MNRKKDIIIKSIAGVFSIIVIVFVIYIFVQVDKSQEKIESTTQYELSDVEKFAKDNNISIDLAKSIEYSLGQIGFSLSQAYNPEQVDDWANGRRFKIWVNMEYILFFYCEEDEVVSIRKSNGEFVWKADA